MATLLPARSWVVLAIAVMAVGGCGTDGGADGRGDGATSTTTTRVEPSSTPSASGTAASTSEPTSPATTAVIAAPVVVVDPGHNGANGRHSAEISRMVDAGGFRKACNTTGTAAPGLTEAEYNWLQSRQLRDALEATGARVVMTRDSNDGWGPCIDERGLTASRNGAAALVSIHADGAAASSSGFHVIHPSQRRVSAPVWQDSARLATSVRDALVDAGLEPADYVGRDGLVERDDLGTLNRAGVPAVMVEMGNMRNSSDLAQLADPARRQAIADAIARAVSTFVSDQQRAGR